ncbi:unnamed protein product [Blepharisma stoltei]|uniref:Uncharacterized protein n=1 Tax=Blepharisma stoltei TaxID=1481888 RepID=A0AAU9JMA7_9CILI|nr:unnamed protein product [Blepharisma stoltei]
MKTHTAKKTKSPKKKTKISAKEKKLIEKQAKAKERAEKKAKKLEQKLKKASKKTPKTAKKVEIIKAPQVKFARISEINEETKEKSKEYCLPKWENEVMSSRKQFYNSFTGFVINFLRINGPTDVQDICLAIDEVYPKLRSLRGERYKGNDMIKAIRALAGFKVCKVEDDIWSLREPQATQYECRKIAILEHRRYLMRTNALMRPDMYSKILKKMQQIESYRREIASDHIFKGIFEKPFHTLRGNESMPEAIRKIGHERFIGFVQGYVLTEVYYDQLKKMKWRRQAIDDRMEVLLQNILQRLNSIEANVELPTERMRREYKSFKLDLMEEGVIVVKAGTEKPSEGGEDD